MCAHVVLNFVVDLTSLYLLQVLTLMLDTDWVLRKIFIERINE